jgi:hypothetical protein
MEMIEGIAPSHQKMVWREETPQICCLFHPKFNYYKKNDRPLGTAVFRRRLGIKLHKVEPFE